VNPETFFDELPAVMKQVPPMPGEEALYNWIGSVLEAAAKDPQIKQTLKDTAVAAEREMIDPFFQWRNNGRAAGNGWNSPVNGAQWGTDYLNRTATAKSNMYDNCPRRRSTSTRTMTARASNSTAKTLHDHLRQGSRRSRVSGL
jgi:hypothetical protein